MRVIDFDHLVLTVADVERSLDFWSGTMGLAAERVDEWRAGTVSLPSVRINATTIIDLVEGAREGSNVDHLCLVVEPVDWQEVIDSGRLTVLEGPVTRWGARGSGSSIYVQDPDDNTLELRWYPQDQ